MINSIFLIGWDLTRLIQNYNKPKSEVNCFGVSDNRLVNDIMWFFARFLASQAEMLAILVNFWKKWESNSIASSVFRNSKGVKKS